MAFDVITPINLGRGAIPVGATTFYTVPADTRTIVKSIDVSNTGVNSNRVTVYLVPSGDSPSTSNTLIPDVSLKGGSVLSWGGAQILNEGDTIQANAGSTGCTINIGGGEAI